MKIIFMNPDSLMNNKNSMKTTIDLGECENILRKKYNLSKEEPMIMIKKELDFQKDCPFLRKTVPTPDGQRHIFPCIHGTPTAGNMGLFQPDLPEAQPRY